MRGSLECLCSPLNLIVEILIAFLLLAHSYFGANVASINTSKWCSQILGEMGSEFSPKMPVKSLTSQQIVRIHQLFRQAKFDDPSGDVSFFLGSIVKNTQRIQSLHWRHSMISLDC